MMIGWRRKARAERARLEAQAVQNPMSSERLYELVNQTLHANFGPLGSYAITRRANSDTDDIFHTMLASSVAHDIVSTLINHQAVPLVAPAPLGGSFVAATSAFAETRALPAHPLAAPAEAPVEIRVGSHAARAFAAEADLAAPIVSAAPVASVGAAAAPVVSVPAAAAPVVALGASAAESAAEVSAPPLAPIVAVPVSADLAAALTVLDETGEIAMPAPIAAVRTHLVDAGR
ncbi:hypothetical protein B7R21_04515 [Subtercola boreus]|uniref:Uncharacterized protein n=1 Tax=Subtercola boreus TaxID=120213 RepID=A0A3E0W125_9MICO|nr:hypothetical protein [Subtercola boreus]RFA15288.1 hypothetical protein B7R21_04515 [Subtercola boreus]